MLVFLKIDWLMFIKYQPTGQMGAGTVVGAKVYTMILDISTKTLVTNRRLNGRRPSAMTDDDGG